MNPSNPVEFALLQQVYGCSQCSGLAFGGEFTPAPSGSFFKFPPLIGGTGKRKLLFVGYNPRRTSNLAIHNFAMSSMTNFCALSNNVDHHGSAYIGSSPNAPDHEPHYDLHDDIVQRVFARPFNDVAAVTEMYLCASVSGSRLNTENSPCARSFLLRTLSIADPDYVVTLGVGLPRYFSRFVAGLRADVLHLPFPSRRQTPPTTMTAAVNWAVASLIALETGAPPPPMTWRWPTRGPNGIMHYP